MSSGNITELSTIMAGIGGEIGGHEIVVELGGGGGCEIFLGYSTSKMHNRTTIYFGETY